MPPTRPSLRLPKPCCSGRDGFKAYRSSARPSRIEALGVDQVAHRRMRYVPHAVSPAVAVDQFPVLTGEDLRGAVEAAEVQGAVAAGDEGVGVQEGLACGAVAVEGDGEDVVVGAVREDPAQCGVDAV